MNNIEQIASMLNVEINEVFCVLADINSFWYYVFRSDGLYKALADGESFYEAPDSDFVDIVTGAVPIIKKPWKPNKNELYYVIDYNPRTQEFYPKVLNWCEDREDILFYYIGNYYKTQEEAIKHKTEWATFYTDIMRGKRDILSEWINNGAQNCQRNK